MGALAAVVALFLSSGLSGAPGRAAGPFPYTRIGAPNGCFVESVAFGDELRTRFDGAVWYRLLQWGAKDGDEVVAGHAVVVFENAGRLWSYDINHGFTPLDVPPLKRDDVPAVAKQATAPYLDKITPTYPIYREDFAQPPDPKPPAPFDDVEAADFRDAGRVAARLALHRTVKMLEFTYPKDDVPTRGVAVAFVFNGRVCIYTPGNGTVPFRVTAITVENLRQLQELLRRIYPGASNLKVR